MSKQKLVRTVRTKVYKFEGLSPEGQQKAIECERNFTISNQDFPFLEDYRRSIDAFIKLFPVRLNRRGDGFAFEGNDEVGRLKGKRLAAFLWNKYKDYLFEGKLYYKGAISGDTKFWHSKCQLEENSCALTGMGYDYALLKPIFEYMRKPTMWKVDFEDLMYYCYAEWSLSIDKEEEYVLSDEYIRENLIENEYEFTADGRLFK